MKKFNSLSFLLILLPLLGIGLWSCGSDDDEPAVTQAIVGTWAYESHTVNVTVNGQNSLEFLMSTLGLTESQALLAQSVFMSQFFDPSDFQGTTMQFRADGTYQISSPSGTDSGTYSLKNNNTILVLDDGDEEVEVAVVELTNSFMTVVFSEEDEYDVTGDENDEDLEVQFSLRVQKQNQWS